MPTIYDQTWPISYIDQKHYADYLLSRAKILYSRMTPITVNSLLEPTQGQWENAYVAETGLPLPIPVGVKMFWRSLKINRVLQYGTINDSNNGLSSTGKVFNLLSLSNAQPSFRFLGLFDNSRNEYYNMSGAANTYVPSLSILPGGSFVLGINNSRIYYWMEQGLESLMFVFKIRTADLIATPSPALNIVFNRNGETNYFSQVGGSNDIETLHQQFFGDKTTAAGFGTPTAAASSPSAAIQTKETGSDSAAGAFSYGQVWLHNVAQSLDLTASPTIQPRENYQNPIGYATGSYIGATVSEANTALNWGMFVKEDQGFTRADFFNLGMDNPVASAPHNARVWVYGLFKKLTGEFNG